MVFSSLEFLFLYFAVTLVMYFSVPFKFRNFVLLIVSLIFYGWGEPIYVFIMFYSIVVDYICGYFAGKYRETDKRKAKMAVIASAVLNLGVLGFFKYYTFIVSNLQLLPFDFLKAIPLFADVELPIGISFYTFQTMSYTIDIYRGDARVQKNITSFGAYVTLFPQLIAGPIVRYQDVDDQLRSRPHNIDMLASGIRTFVCGLAKKILLANAAGQMWDHFRELGAVDATVLGSWVGLIFYAFQIYFDFSGYSDMAIGLGKMLGFRFKENFYYPYVSKSITEFWRRWHISMSTFFRDYVYFPLGGSRCSTLKWIRNIAVVWFLTGLWHGAEWNFVLWGLYFAVILLLEKFLLSKILPKLPVINHLYSLLLIVYGWVIFRETSISGIAEFTKAMFGGYGLLGNGTSSVWTLLYQADVGTIAIISFIVGIIASTPILKKIKEKTENSKVFPVIADFILVVLFFICTIKLALGSYNPFIYFKF